MRSITARLNRLEATRPRLFADILSLIARHAYYDEITPREQTRYCEFIRVPKQAFEDVNKMVLGDQHIMLAKVDPPTPEELAQIIQDIENYVNQGGFFNEQV